MVEERSRKFIRFCNVRKRWTMQRWCLIAFPVFAECSRSAVSITSSCPTLGLACVLMPKPPREDTGNTSFVSPACRKRRLNGPVCRNHRKERVVPCRCRTGTFKNPAKCLLRWEPDRRFNFFFIPPTKCLWRWEPDRRSNFFFIPPAHLCAVTCMTEISLIVTLNNEFSSVHICAVTYMTEISLHVT